VKLTNAHYLTPKSRVIDGKGVVPDVVVKMEPKLQATRETDTQLKKAIEVLRAKF
jgi:C-terminal processing protease CtpA/Prc